MIIDPVAPHCQNEYHSLFDQLLQYVILLMVCSLASHHWSAGVPHTVGNSWWNPLPRVDSSPMSWQFLAESPLIPCSASVGTSRSKHPPDGKDSMIHYSEGSIHENVIKMIRPLTTFNLSNEIKTMVPKSKESWNCYHLEDFSSVDCHQG
jgi:hypothetical protein